MLIDFNLLVLNIKHHKIVKQDFHIVCRREEDDYKIKRVLLQRHVKQIKILVFECNAEMALKFLTHYSHGNFKNSFGKSNYKIMLHKLLGLTLNGIIIQMVIAPCYYLVSDIYLFYFYDLK